MGISFTIPAELEQLLRQRIGNLEESAKEEFLVGLYRKGKLTHFELSQAMGLGRLETEEILKRHRVTEDAPTAQEVEAERLSLARILGPARRAS
jgi:hypothetical protein